MRLKGRRRRVVAGAFMAVPALIFLASFAAPGPRLSVTAVAASALPLPTPTPTPTPITCLLTPTPLPLPLVPTPIPLPLCTPIPTPIPTLPPIPSVLPSPPPGTVLPPGTVAPGTNSPPTGFPGPGIPGQPAGSGPGFPGPGTTGGTTTGPGSSSFPNAGGAGSSPQTWPQSISGYLVVADPLLAAQINVVLGNPIAAQRPDLLHFSVLGASPASFITGGILGVGGGSGLPTLLAATVGALLLVGVASGLFVLALRAPWRRLISGVLAVAAALAVALTATAALLISQPANSRPTSAHGGPHTPTAVVSAPATLATWTTLIGIENSLTALHDQAVADERDIATIVLTLQQPPDKIGGPHSLRPTAPMILTAELRALIANYHAVALSYDQSLQREYGFFRAAAQSPEQLTALQTASLRTPPNVQQAVSYDVNLVQTQLAQEAAISGAIDQASPVIQQQAAIVGPVTFHAPLSGVVSQAFGQTSFSLEPPVTYRGVFYQHFHTGLDIAAPRGALMGAAAPGTVLLATTSRDSRGNMVGYGNYVVIQHSSGFLTLYGHLDRLLVAAGQQVAQGQVIGLCGSTGWSTGPHVHFEVRINGEFVDPAPYIASQIHY